MANVKGIGGIFFRTKDPETINAWYRENLGVPVSEDGCAIFPWREESAPGREQSTIWSVFPADTDYFGNGRQEFMVNYIVDSLDEFLAQLKRQGVPVDDRVEESEFGRFGWATDPEGRRIELWEPPKK